MKKRASILLLMLNLLALSGFSQHVALEKADKKYDAFAYIDAIRIYEQIAKKGYKDENMFRKLGNAYYFNSEFAKAETAYAELFALNPDQDQELMFRYAQSLKSVGKYEQSEAIMVKFREKAENDQRARLFHDNRDYLQVIEANSGRYVVENSGINSEYSDYGASLYGDQLVFTSARSTAGFAKRVHKWNNQSFTNLYRAGIAPNDSLGKPERFSAEIDSRFHEATAVFSKDGKTMYFTRNNFNKKRKGKNSDNVVLLKLYRAKFSNGKWGNVTELPFNSNQYNTAHPALSPNGDILYFVSDMPGGFGQSDLYKVAVKANGTFGKPENLGSKINTPGRESFPFAGTENELYFASDGHPGLGGLDVFLAGIRNSDFGIVRNVGKPVNGPADDFAFMLNPKTRTGYFTSNREGGKGSDDIYAFTELKRLSSKQILEGVVRDSRTNDPVGDAQVVVYDEKMQKIQVVKTDKNGFYKFEPIENDVRYYIRIDKDEYETDEIPLDIPKNSQNTNIPVVLKKQLLKIEPGTDLAAADVLNIASVYFDLDQWTIHQTAEIELEKIVAVMNQFPTMKIDVRSHTDSRQTKQYNQQLSDKRAQATIEWLVKNGISANRLTGRGYGESQLINKCADGVPCTEAEHQMNRRSQFIVLEK